MAAKAQRHDPQARTLISQNRRVRHQYAIQETLEAGIVLCGTEVKACRKGQVQLADAFVQVLGQQAFLMGGHIAEYAQGNRFNHPPVRPRKLLLHRREIDKLESRLRASGVSAVPLSFYFKDGRVKVEVGIGVGKGAVDKRQDIKAREAQREVDRAMRGRTKR